MKGLFVVCLLVAVVYCQIGGTRGPCSAQAIPGPFTSPVSLFSSLNTGATATAINCNSDDLDGPTIWYSITPTAGSQVTVSTCASYTNFDTILVAYSGNCDSLSCVTLGDDSDACQVNDEYSQIQFMASAEIYYIAVTGYNGATGNFELTFSEAESNATTTCQTAIVVPGPYTTPITIYGNTENAVGYSGSCGLTSTSHIDWYILTPEPGSQVEVTTCNTVTNFDTRLSVLTGTCSLLSCIVENDDNCTTNSLASSVTFAAAPSATQYFLAVFGYGTGSGTYEVRIVEHPVQSTPGSACTTSIPLPFYSGSQYYFGNTANNPSSVTSACFSLNSPSAWYRLDVPGSYSGQITVTTCNTGTNYDTVVAVYTGSCSNLICVSYNDDASCSIYNLASTVTWYVSRSAAADAVEASTQVSNTPTPTSSRTGTITRSSTMTPSRMSSRSPSPSRSSYPVSQTPTRTPSAATGTITYYIQVAGFSTSSIGNYGLSIQIQ